MRIGDLLYFEGWENLLYFEGTDLAAQAHLERTVALSSKCAATREFLCAKKVNTLFNAALPARLCMQAFNAAGSAPLEWLHHSFYPQKFPFRLHIRKICCTFATGLE